MTDFSFSHSFIWNVMCVMVPKFKRLLLCFRVSFVFVQRIKRRTDVSFYCFPICFRHSTCLNCLNCINSCSTWALHSDGFWLLNYFLVLHHGFVFVIQYRNRWMCIETSSSIVSQFLLLGKRFFFVTSLATNSLKQLTPNCNFIPWPFSIQVQQTILNEKRLDYMAEKKNFIKKFVNYNN